MKLSLYYSLCTLFIAVLLLLPQQALAQESFTEMGANGAPSKNVPAQQVTPALTPAASSAVLTFYFDRPTFDIVTGGLPNEDFEGSNVPVITACAGPFDSATNDACYSPGVLIPGFSVDNANAGNDPAGLVVIAPGVLGNPTTIVGPNFFSDDTDIFFSAGNVDAAGFDLVDVFGGNTWNVEFFGPGGSLGSTPATGSVGGSFVGALSTGSNIVRIEIRPIAGAPNAELIDNLCFGNTNSPPDCSAAAADPDELWPPNHKMKDIDIVGVTDPDGDPVTITVTGITQDEPVNAIGNGDGNTAPDGDGVGSSTAQVRAERAGGGNGRVYEISFEADDGNGGTCTGAVQVCVPHDQSGSGCVDDGQVFDSTSDSAAPKLIAADEAASLTLKAYPNPFNPTTTITYTVAQAEQVQLVVYDVMGREVARLVDGAVDAGTHQVAFEAGNLASGAYLVRMVTAQTSLTRQVVLMK